MSNTAHSEEHKAEMRAKLYRLAMDLRQTAMYSADAYALSIQIEDLAERRYPEGLAEETVRSLPLEWRAALVAR